MFTYNTRRKQKEKITCKIAIPQNIVSNSKNYILHGMIVHRGPTSHTGHYYTIVR